MSKLQFKMDGFDRSIGKFFSYTTSIQFYSTPSFALETFLAIIISVLYVILHLELTSIARRTLRMPNAYYSKPLRESSSKESFRTSITRIHHEYYRYDQKQPSTHVTFKKISNSCGSTTSQMGWTVQNTGDGMRTPVPVCHHFVEDNHRVADNLLSLTPSEYVQMEKNRRAREKELQNCITSLTTLYTNVLNRRYSDKTLQKQIEGARESVECAKTNIKHLTFKTDAMTKSLFNLLERIVDASSVENPLPFKGDLTSLALDVGDLVRTPSEPRLNVNDNDMSSIISNGTDEMSDLESYSDYLPGM